MTTVAAVRARALAALPAAAARPQRLDRGEYRPAGRRVRAAGPGPALAVSARDCGRDLRPGDRAVTLVKPARAGFTTLLTAAIGYFAADEPCPILALLPTEADARDYVVSDVEPVFAATPALRGALSFDRGDEGAIDRNTLLSAGASPAAASRSSRPGRRATSAGTPRAF